MENNMLQPPIPATYKTFDSLRERDKVFKSIRYNNPGIYEYRKGKWSMENWMTFIKTNPTPELIKLRMDNCLANADYAKSATEAMVYHREYEALAVILTWYNTINGGRTS